MLCKLLGGPRALNRLPHAALHPCTIQRSKKMKNCLFTPCCLYQLIASQLSFFRGDSIRWQRCPGTSPKLADFGVFIGPNVCLHVSSGILLFVATAHVHHAICPLAAPMAAFRGVLSSFSQP